MMKAKAEFLLSATSPDHFPDTRAPEVAFLGRSNVGKSSLLNSLAGARVARVSNTPGRTQAINFFALQFGAEKKAPDLILADLPGYGYARVPRAIVSEWPKFIEPYLKDRPNLALCVCLVDACVPPKDSDQRLFEWLASQGRASLVVATKTDRLSGNELTKSLRELEAALDVKPLVYSSKTGRGRDLLWRAILDTAKPKSRA